MINYEEVKVQWCLQVARLAMKSECKGEEHRGKRIHSIAKLNEFSFEIMKSLPMVYQADDLLYDIVRECVGYYTDLDLIVLSEMVKDLIDYCERYQATRAKSKLLAFAA